jgi:hypothetical protein
MSQPTKQELIDHIESLVTKVVELIRERDEARREVCSMKSFNFDQRISPEAYAALNKWDCYKEDTNQ